MVIKFPYNRRPAYDKPAPTAPGVVLSIDTAELDRLENALAALARALRS